MVEKLERTDEAYQALAVQHLPSFLNPVKQDECAGLLTAVQV